MKIIEDGRIAEPNEVHINACPSAVGEQLIEVH